MSLDGAGKPEYMVGTWGEHVNSKQKGPGPESNIGLPQYAAHCWDIWNNVSSPQLSKIYSFVQGNVETLHIYLTNFNLANQVK